MDTTKPHASPSNKPEDRYIVWVETPYLTRNCCVIDTLDNRKVPFPGTMQTRATFKECRVYADRLNAHFGTQGQLQT